MARPKKEIKQAEFEKLCGLQCTKTEIASFFNCSEDTVERWCKETYGKSFAVIFAEKRGAGLVSLRRAQFRLAQSNATMAIFLGKNYLGQSNEPIAFDVEDTDAIFDAIEEGLEGDAE